jgi:hypothetical protein
MTDAFANVANESNAEAGTGSTMRGMGGCGERCGTRDILRVRAVSEAKGRGNRCGRFQNVMLLYVIKAPGLGGVGVIPSVPAAVEIPKPPRVRL